MNSIHAYIKINEANREYKLESRTYKYGYHNCEYTSTKYYKRIILCLD